MGLTRFVLKRPVATVMTLLCLLVFGISSVFSATLEQMPDTDTPMLIVMGRYSGAGPEDINELVTEPIEDEVSTLEGVKGMSSSSSDGPWSCWNMNTARIWMRHTTTLRRSWITWNASCLTMWIHLSWR